MPDFPAQPDDRRKLVAVTVNTDRVSAQDMVANRLNAQALRVYSSDIQEYTQVDRFVEEDREYRFDAGITVQKGPITLGTPFQDGDAFETTIELHGADVSVTAADAFTVTGPTELRVPSEFEGTTLTVRGSTELDALRVDENVDVRGNVTANVDGAHAAFHDVDVHGTVVARADAEFRRPVVFQNAEEDTEGTIHGNAFDGNARTATEWASATQIDVGGNYFQAESFSLRGDESEPVSITLTPVDSNASGNILFTGGAEEQIIESTKVFRNTNLKFDPPDVYGIEGGWSERWREPMRLTLAGDLEGDVAFDGSEDVTVHARVLETLGAASNVRLFVSSTDGDDTNAGNTPNYPFRSVRRAAEVARDYVERRAGRFFNASKVRFPPRAYRIPRNDPDRTSAADAIWKAREDLVGGTTSFLTSNYTELSQQPTSVPGFATVEDICKRDARFLIQAVCSDLTYGGTVHMSRAAAKYFAQFKQASTQSNVPPGSTRSGSERLVLPSDQVSQTLAVWDELRRLMVEDVSVEGEPLPEEVEKDINALFEGFADTINDPLPLQTNFSIEARSTDGFGIDQFPLPDLILNPEDDLQTNVDGSPDTFLNKWQGQIEAYLNALDPPLETDPATFGPETVRAILVAVGEDLRDGGIVRAAKKAGEFFANNLRTVPDADVRPMVQTLQYAERIVVEDARARTQTPVSDDEIDAFRRLMDGVYTTLQFPTTFVPTPVTIFVTSGIYVEKTPIYLAPNVSVVGDSLRSVLLYGDKSDGSDRRDFFHCNTGTYLVNLRFRDLREPGFCVAFPAALVDVVVSADDDDPETGEPRYFQVASPPDETPGDATVLFSYDGYTKFDPPKVYVDEPRDSNTVVQEIIVTDPGSGYTQEFIDLLQNDGRTASKIRDVRERLNMNRDTETGEPLKDEYGRILYYDEDNPIPESIATPLPNRPDRRAAFTIDVDGGTNTIRSIELKMDPETERFMHGKGYRGQAAFLDLPEPDTPGGRRARAIVIMRSDYAELVVDPDDGIDEDGRIRHVRIVYPGSGYTDTSEPWISIPPPTDLQPYVNASPYVQNCSNLAGPFDLNGNLIPKTLPLPYDVNNVYATGEDIPPVRVNPNGAGGGIRIDGVCVAPRSPVPSFVTDAFTQLNQGGIGFLLINRAYAQLVSTFGLFCSTHIKALGGSTVNISNTVTDFGIESMHSRGYWPVPYATVTVVPPRVPTLVDENGEQRTDNLPVADNPVALDAGMFNPKPEGESHGVFVPEEGYRSETRLDETLTSWGTGYEELVVTDAEFETSNGAYYVLVEIDAAPSETDGNLTARFESPSNEYLYLEMVDPEPIWRPFFVDGDGRWIDANTEEEITHRTARVRTLVRVTDETVVPDRGELVPLVLATDWAQGDDRETLTDRDRFAGAGYKDVPNVTALLRSRTEVAAFDETTNVDDVLANPAAIEMRLTRVSPVAVLMDDADADRLVRPKFMSVCRINGNWHTIRGVTRVAAEGGTDLSGSGFQRGEYLLSLFPSVNWVNVDARVELYDASYISTNSHAMEFVGSGITYNALPEYGGVPNSAGEVVEFAPGRIFFTTQDQLGNTRIGKEFAIDQLSGRVTINTDQFNLAGLSAIGPFRDDNGDTVGVQLREVSNNPNLVSAAPGNTVPTQEAVLGYLNRFQVPPPTGNNLTLQARTQQGVLQMVWDFQAAGALVGTLPNDVDGNNVVPESLNVTDLVASGNVVANSVTAETITTNGDVTIEGNVVAHTLGQATTHVRGVWKGNGTENAAGRLAGVPMAYTCQVNKGSVHRLSFGGGAVTNTFLGVRMPKAGTILAVTVQGDETVRPVVDGVARPETFSEGVHDTNVDFQINDPVAFETVNESPGSTTVVTFFAAFA